METLSSSLLHVLSKLEEDRMEKNINNMIYCSVFFKLRRRPFSCSGHLSSKCMEFHNGSSDRSGVERAIGFFLETASDSFQLVSIHRVIGQKQRFANSSNYGFTTGASLVMVCLSQVEVSSPMIQSKTVS